MLIRHFTLHLNPVQVKEASRLAMAASMLEPPGKKGRGKGGKGKRGRGRASGHAGPVVEKAAEAEIPCEDEEPKDEKQEEEPKDEKPAQNGEDLKFADWPEKALWHITLMTQTACPVAIQH